MKLLIDTNVLFDYYSRRMPFYSDAIKLRVAATSGDVELWASMQSFPEIEYVMRKSMPLASVRRAMRDSMEFLNICVPFPRVLPEGLDSGWPDLEDFIIAASAEHIRADRIITRDAKGFAGSKVPACSPSEFFEWLESEYGVVYEEVDF